MSLEIVEFHLARQRVTMHVGERLHVKLEAGWDPPSEGGSEIVRFSCRPATYTVEPASMTITVPDEGESVTVAFRIKVEGEESGLVEIVAETSENSSMDSIRLRVEK